MRHGPGTNVEVLPLTVVNLLQNMNSGTLEKKTLTTRTDRDSGWMPKQGQTITSKEDDVYNSDFDDDTDSNECYDSESNQLKQVNCEDEFRDADLEELVNLEGSHEML